MKNTTKLALCLTSASLLAPFAAQAERTYNNIIRPYQSARSVGMGGVRYTTGLYDENFFANPARVIDSPKWRIDIVNIMVELNSGAISNIDKITGGGDEIDKLASTAGSNNHVRVQTVIPAYYSHAFGNGRYAAALGLVTSMQGDIGLRRNMSLEPNVFTDVGPALTVARRFLKEDRLAIGVTAHYMYRLATQNSFSTVDYIKGNKFNKDTAMGEGSRMDFDVGARHDLAWKPKGWEFQAALAMNNVTGTSYKANKPDLVSGSQPKPPRQPRTLNTGVSATKEGFLHFTKGTFAFEIQDIGNNDGGSLFRLLHIGGELAVKDYIFLRGGINQGYFCAGVGFDLPVLKLDLATYGEEMSLNTGGLEDRRYALRFGLAI
jgi:hypothetical protein